MDRKKHRHANRLIDETSPYLLQHAHNPVDWHSWGKEALARAKKENKPMFLSIGYSACHWCHVMEKESFENEEIAAILNEHFVCIKVDREEHPDLDEIYMRAVVALTGSGGWPMNVFLTPKMKPFYGGTYFPPEDKWGRVGLKNLLLRLVELWADEKNRAKLLQDAETLEGILEQRASFSVPREGRVPSYKRLLDSAVRRMEASFDPVWGGFGGPPKFPPSGAISLLLRDYHHNRNRRSLEMALFTLDKMHEGGMYDHLGGGFHRYSVDREWLVPHFEKMLYDNAQLAAVYLEAYQVTGVKVYAAVAREIFEYVMSAMTGTEGGFYSSEDADSQGKEGLFYLWRREELSRLLEKDEAETFSFYYDLKKGGNFSSPEEYHRGQNILHLRKDIHAAAEGLGITKEELETKLSSARKKLLKARERRERPGLDDKIIASWNALMISALSRGYQVLESPEYLHAAEKAVAFLMEKMRTEDGKLLRTFRGGKPKFYAYLEDYAFAARALIDLYEAGFDEKWLLAAQDLADEISTQFWEEKTSCLFNTSRYHQNLILRTRSETDSAIPSPVGVAVEAFIRLSKLLGREDLFDKADRILGVNLPYLEKAPRSYVSLLRDVDFLVHPLLEIAVVGPSGGKRTDQLLRTIHERFIPNRIIAFLDPDRADAAELGKKIPPLAGRTLADARAAVYVCRDFTCRLPATSPEELLERLHAE
jgi:uncharacterized protein YyaL (SSP411 family)